MRSSSGFVLVTALLILVVMTLLGVTAISTVTLQERMASNLREKARAFAAAEAAIGDGERWLRNRVTEPAPAALPNGQVLALPNAAGVVQAPQYSLVEAATREVSGSQILPATQGGTRSRALVHYYQVQGFGWGGNRNAVSEQESIYAKIY